MSSQQEREEMELVLRSGVFDRAPRLAKFFAYICQRHFDGQSDQVKEYSIALEALGRPADFDPKKDSIVRVEAHRLRKRLEEYYRTAGTDDPIEIVIPSGQYRPHFRIRNGKPPEQAPLVNTPTATSIVELPELQSAPVVPPLRKVWFSQPWILFPALAIVIAAVGSFLWHSSQAHRKSSSVPEVRSAIAASSIPSSAEPPPAELRILAGYRGPIYMDRQGHAWQADCYFQGGTSEAISPEHLIEGQPDPHLLRSTRFGNYFQYDIPLRQGTYELHLYFAETQYGRGNRLEGGDSTRIFDVGVNGKMRLATLDPLAEAGGPNRLLERVLKDVGPAVDGKLHLSFSSTQAPAMVSGIEILPSQPGRIHPIRIVAQSSPVTDSDGRVWAADEYYFGGNSVSRENVLVTPKERALYQGERYGNFSYRIPLAPGKYRLTLYFVEQWFGTPASAMAPPSERVFDLFANRNALLKNFTPGTEAGGVNRTLERSFDNVAPNAQGMLLLEFVPVRNYAEINAIEVVETQ